MTPEEAILGELWRRGEAWRFLCDSGVTTGGQVAWLERFASAPAGSTTVWMISRQRGKSFAALAYACAFALGNPGSIIRYAALTGKSARAIVEPTLDQITATMPANLRPRLLADRGQYEFSNGSTLTWAGTDNEQFDRLRGPRAHLVLLDESAFYADLERVESALLPQLQTTGGRALYLSSPPETPAHAFARRYEAATRAGRGQHATIHDNPRLGAAGVESIAKAEAERLGLTLAELYASTYWRREFLAELVTEETRAALPAWTVERAALLTRAVARPHIFDGYVSCDWGVSPDPKAALFAWYSPATGLHVEAELELLGATPGEFSARCKERERELWGVERWSGTLLGIAELRARAEREVPEYLMRKAKADAPRQPYLRVGDDDPEVLIDLVTTYDYAVLPTKKHDKHHSVEELNHLLVNERITIAPTCARLLEQCHTTLWNRARTQWERTAKDHGDLVDCLVYLARNVSWHRQHNVMEGETRRALGIRTVGDARGAGWGRAFGAKTG